ncbi:hypothetical protein K458DRAFT_391268 [Lentithecium fluviatile CBS 122367]|uniref:Uncharacterized protein n=1 Tax=Lentithecium fluviatile CBS 122367 TaxID=1168545 RepID=A0A6G1IWA3_9PLEO|nr:hypothetical protein K458DRAFT_391268 [Lentithecium fluviatile CBS 122367]
MSHSDPNTPVDDPSRFQEEATEAHKKMMELAEANDIPTDVLSKMDQEFRTVINTFEYLDTPQQLGKLRAKFIEKMTPLIERNSQLDPNQQAYIPIMTTVHLPSPSNRFGSPARQNPSTPLPVGLDRWFEIDLGRNSCRDLHNYAKAMKGALAKDSKVLTNSSAYKQFLSDIDRFLQMTSEEAGTSDDRAREFYNLLKKNYQKRKPGMYRTEPSTPQPRTPPWPEPSPRSSGSLSKRPTKRQLKDLPAPDRMTELERQRWTFGAHYSYENTSPGGTERVLGNPPTAETAHLSPGSRVSLPSPQGQGRQSSGSPRGRGSPAGPRGRDYSTPSRGQGEKGYRMDIDEGPGKGRGAGSGKKK